MKRYFKRLMFLLVSLLMLFLFSLAALADDTNKEPLENKTNETSAETSESDKDEKEEETSESDIDEKEEETSESGIDEKEEETSESDMNETDTQETGDDENFLVSVPAALKMSNVVSGNPQKDILTIANSQLGYREAQDAAGNKYTCYAKFCKDNPCSWSCEFAAWCLFRSGMDDDDCRYLTSEDHYMIFFSSLYKKRGNVYVLENSNAASQKWVGSYTATVKTIKLSAIKPGDLIQVCSSAKNGNQPDHTAIVYKVDTNNKLIYTYEGDAGSDKLKSVAASSYTPSDVYALVRPDYDTFSKYVRMTEKVCKKLGHIYAKSVKVPGTCKKHNTILYKCIHCGYSYTKKEGYGDHLYVLAGIFKDATPASAGKALYTCSECGVSYEGKYLASSFTVKGLKYTITNGRKVKVTGAADVNIKELLIPEKVKFNGISYKVDEISAGAFKNYKELKNLSIQANLSKINAKAFYGCKKLSNITFTSKTVPGLAKKIFYGTASKMTVKVPKASLAKYKKLFKKYGILKKMKIKKL